MTSPDPTLPVEERTSRGSVVREVIGLLLMVVGIVGLLAVAHYIDPLLAYAAASALLTFAGWRLTIAEE